MPNPYPARFDDDSGVTRLDGEIVFTDPANQPGGAGVNATLSITTPGGTADFAGVVVGGDTPEGTLHGSLTYLVRVSAMAQVVDSGQIQAIFAGLVASTNDNRDMTLDIEVFSATSNNRAIVSGASSVAQPVTDLAGDVNASGVPWNILAGADLSAVGDVLSSTAGGLFIVTVLATSFWD